MVLVVPLTVLLVVVASKTSMSRKTSKTSKTSKVKLGVVVLTLLLIACGCDGLTVFS